MVLLHDVVEIFDFTDGDGGAVLRIIALDGRFIGRTPVDGDLLRHAVAACSSRSAAPGKFEAKRFCSDKRVITRCYVTYFRIFIVLYMKEPSHADPPAPLSR